MRRLLLPDEEVAQNHKHHDEHDNHNEASQKKACDFTR